MKFKVGDKVKAISNNTIFTSERMKWAGVVTKVTEDGFSAKTTKHLLLTKQENMREKCQACKHCPLCALIFKAQDDT